MSLLTKTAHRTAFIATVATYLTGIYLHAAHTQGFGDGALMIAAIAAPCFVQVYLVNKLTDVYMHQEIDKLRAQ
tara:strand:+ start:338 stop:559 length:222 start_codon:yes stop_codon:yes gene_type:complete